MIRTQATRLFAALCLALFAALPVQAQSNGQVYLQIEAHPTLARAQDAAAAYAARLTGVSGYRVPGGWYAITVGPFATRETALGQLRTLRRAGAVPADSFTVEATRLGQRYYPVGAAPAAPVVAAPAPQTPAAPPAPAPAPAAFPDETPREARISERALDGDARRALQEAMQWYGFYTSTIDGAFGPGTRRAMADWQAAQGYEPSGVLTTRQRDELMSAYRGIFAALGLETVVDREAGIEMLLPMAMITRGTVEPPFVRYGSASDDGVEALLISQEGDQGTLFGLYDIMQTLEIVPADGERTRRPTSFTLTGQDTQRHSYTYATLAGGAVKGFTLVWRPQDDRVMSRIAQQMQASFTAINGAVLPDVAGSGDMQSIDLVAGLEIRRPIKSRSALWVDGAGRAVTSVDLLDAACGRYTLAGDFPARVMARDDVLGLALLAPDAALAPPAIAGLRGSTPRLRSEVAVAGFPFEGRLDLPSVTFGQLEDIRGLQGEDGVHRLKIATLAGDAGGPVFDMGGAVTGLLQAVPDGSRALPADVRFSVSADRLRAFLSTAGVSVTSAPGGAPMAPEDITRLAADTVVLASCWE